MHPLPMPAAHNRTNVAVGPAAMSSFHLPRRPWSQGRDPGASPSAFAQLDSQAIAPIRTYATFGQDRAITSIRAATIRQGRIGAPSGMGWRNGRDPGLVARASQARAAAAPWTRSGGVGRLPHRPARVAEPTSLVVWGDVPSRVSPGIVTGGRAVDGTAPRSQGRRPDGDSPASTRRSSVGTDTKKEGLCTTGT